MRILAILSLALMSFNIACSGASAQDCALKQYASLDLVADPQVAPVIDAKVGGRPVHLIVDTGGIYTTLDPSVIGALGLERHRISNLSESYDVNGKLDSWYAEVPDVEIGPIHLDKMPMVVAQLPATSDINGSLAPDFLSRFDLDFDFAHRKLNLFSPEHCEGKVVYWAPAYAEVPFRIDGTHIVVTMTLDGHDVSAAIDTGSSHSMILDRFAHNVLGLDDKSPERVTIANSKPDDLFHYAYLFKSLFIDGLEVKNPLLLALPDNARQAFRRQHQDDDRLRDDPIYGYDIREDQVILGADVLSTLHMYVSYKEKKIYLTSADAR